MYREEARPAAEYYGENKDLRVEAPRIMIQTRFPNTAQTPSDKPAFAVKKNFNHSAKRTAHKSGRQANENFMSGKSKTFLR
jgi:hypothetical protein